MKNDSKIAEIYDQNEILFILSHKDITDNPSTYSYDTLIKEFMVQHNRKPNFTNLIPYQRSLKKFVRNSITSLRELFESDNNITKQQWLESLIRLRNHHHIIHQVSEYCDRIRNIISYYLTNKSLPESNINYYL